LAVDLVVKVQKTSYVIPGISQKTNEFKVFNSELGKIKDIRNRFQHINGDVMNADSDNLLGSISWLQ